MITISDVLNIIYAFMNVNLGVMMAMRMRYNNFL